MIPATVEFVDGHLTIELRRIGAGAVAAPRLGGVDGARLERAIAVEVARLLLERRRHVGVAARIEHHDGQAIFRG